MSDEAHWASSFVNWTLLKVGVEGTRSRRALSWLAWGQALEKPAAGCVAVLDYGGGRGHVAFVEGVYHDMVVLLGGNQNDSVSRVAFAAAEIAGYRSPSGEPVPPASYDLPQVEPTMAQSKDLPLYAVPSSDANVSEFQSRDGSRHLKVQQLQADRIRFEITVTSGCTRTASGTAYEIYPEDMEIDSESGIGFPVREYFFWGDSRGQKGLRIRLSVKGAARARIADWGYGSSCPLSAEP